MRSILLLLILPVVLATVDLMILGDWGGSPIRPYTMPGQVAAAAGMGVVADKLKAQAVLALGDNFYTYGIKGDDKNHRFEDTWNSVYTAQSLMQIPWYVVAGNHDYKGNVTAQVAYSQDNSRWQFPSIYHSHSFTSSDGTTVDVILIDTIDLSGSSAAVEETDPEYFKPLPNKPRTAASTQWDWIEQTLKASKAQYILVGGHYPVYSVCEHGNTQNLLDNLKPLLEQYGAHYLSGHDHCMESMLDSATGVQYILSGMGDTCCYDDSNLENVPAEMVQWYVSRGRKPNKNTIGGFTSVTASPSAMSFTFYDQDGVALYTTPAINPRKL